MHTVTKAFDDGWIALHRGIEIGTAGTKREAQLICARDAISSHPEYVPDLVYDVAANVGQMVGNVKHMQWFIEAVADEIPEA